MSQMKLQPVRIEDETKLRCEFQLETTGGNPFRTTLIAKFIGEYQDGSSGKPDSRFMAGMVEMAVAIWHPAAVVLDLSELQYEWGDDMANLLPPNAGGKKSAVVVGPKCVRAIATLMWGVNTMREATEAEFIFDDVKAAWEYVRDRR